METRLPCKVSETQFMWLGVYYFRKFVSVPVYNITGFDLSRVLNCVNLHLFIDSIHDCCIHMIPLVHFKQINTKNFITAIGL